MICTLIPGIQSISGTANKKSRIRVVFQTRKSPTTNPNKVRMYLRTAESYERKSTLSEKEIAARERFKKCSNSFANMAEEQKRKYHKEWKAAKYKFNGKQYATLRGYIMARLYAENKNE